MLNQVVLTGNLGADPEIFYSSEGDPVVTFNLAFKSSKKKEACWIKSCRSESLATPIQQRRTAFMVIGKFIFKSQGGQN
jgi:hypothetical protein